jgi:Uncharacterized protein conserved in bacteria
VQATRPRCALALLLAALSASCGTTGHGGPRYVDAGVGDNLVGEPCRVVAAPPTQATDVGARTAYDVRCGKWEQPSARIVRITTAVPEQQLLAASLWRDRLNEIAVCGPPVTGAALAGARGTGMDCTLRRGGWPYRALAVRDGGDVWLAESIPAAMPAVEGAIDVVAGHSEPLVGASKQDEAMQRLMASIGRSLYSVGDLQAYHSLLRLAREYNLQGNYAEAERRYRDALALQQKVSATDPAGQAYTLMHLALELSNQERFGEAEALFKRSEQLMSNTADPTDEARLLSYRAIHLGNQQKSREAAQLAHEATEMRAKLAKENGLEAGAFTATGFAEFSTSAGPRVPTAAVLTTQSSTARGDMVQSKYVEGAMLLRQDRLDEAEAVLAEAMEIFQSDERIPRRWLPQVRLTQAEVAERQGHLGEAERLLQSTIAALQLQSAGSRTEGTTLLALGRVYSAQGRNADSLAAFRSGFAIIRQAGADLRSDQTSAYFRAGLDEIRRSPDQHQQLAAEMFVVAQMVRGSITAQTLAQAAARLAASDQPVGSVIRELQDARTARETTLERLTLAQADVATLPPQLDALEAQLHQLEVKVARLEREVQAAAPRYNQFLDAPVEATKLRDALHPGEAMIQVLIAADGGVGFLIDREGIVAYPIDLTEAQEKQLVKQIRIPFDAGRYKRYDLTSAYEMYVRLFGPVRDRLAATDHVIFVPSGPLLSLPIGVLVDKEVETTEGKPDYSQVPWLLRRHALTLAPSVQSFYNLRTVDAPSHATKPFVGFGDFVPDRDVDSVLTLRGLPEGCRSDVMSVAQAPALPNTVPELRAVASALGTSERLVLGQAFSEDGVKAAGLQDYRVVYFATHGLLPHELNCWNEPSLITSKPPTEEGDGMLTASEIMTLKLDADLVVLSACNTGGPGTETGGESLSGLARAFFYAGARSLLVTHWSIPDAPTVQLMVSAFKHLGSEGTPTAVALQRAQLELIADPRSAHPLNWGAFTVVGDGGSGVHAAPRSTVTAHAG